MAYVALYRKYRSQSFDELMGQEAVTTTLRNALAAGKFGHAYLFHGARGCGKTSTARLLARALNCISRDGPTPNPCGECALCTSIRDGRCLDVIEMDAASETGIDDVREKVIENVQYAPAEARYKVYIIDEAHDLSAKAFDALLKTLEEPPAHIVFILCTTEVHKVPITIRSRCQAFQFRRGTLQDLTTAVQRVVEAEGSTAEPEAVEAIARSAEGSWRDALSILEQVMAYSDGAITTATVRQAIGAVGAGELSELMAAVGQGSLADVIDSCGSLIDTGIDARQLIAGLQDYVRDLLCLVSGARKAAAELGEERLAHVRPQASLFSAAALLDVLTELSAAEREIRLSNHHRWILERTLARCHAGVHGEQASPSRPAALPSTAPLSATPSPLPRRPPAPQPAASASLAPEPAPERTRGPFAEAVSLDVIQRIWPEVKDSIIKSYPGAASLLARCKVTGLDGQVVVLSFPDAFSCEGVQKPKRQEAVQRKLCEALQADGYRIRCELSPELNGAARQETRMPAQGALPDAGAAVEAVVQRPAPEEAAPPGSLRAEVLQVMGGEIVRSEPEK